MGYEWFCIYYSSQFRATPAPAPMLNRPSAHIECLVTRAGAHIRTHAGAGVHRLIIKASVDAGLGRMVYIIFIIRLVKASVDAALQTL